MMELEACSKCLQKPRRVRIMCSCGRHVESRHGMGKAVAAWNRHAKRDAVEGSAGPVFSIGDIVSLKPFDDITAVVRGIYISENELKYECAWFRNDGSRCIEFLPWVRYDGTPETLPCEPSQIITKSGVAVYTGNKECVIESPYFNCGGGRRVMKAGCLWAYLPFPPEGMR